jgi:hypothetical protein
MIKRNETKGGWDGQRSGQKRQSMKSKDPAVESLIGFSSA